MKFLKLVGISILYKRIQHISDIVFGLGNNKKTTINW